VARGRPNVDAKLKPVRAKRAAKGVRQGTALALAPALAPIVDLCLQLSVTSPEMERVLRNVFVERAARWLLEHRRGARAASDLKVALMVGIHRNFVREIRSLRPRAAVDRPRRGHRAEALLDAWSSDWRFLNESGQPRDLPIQAAPGEPSFEMLVQECLPGVSMRTALAELRRSGSVRLLAEEQVRLRSRTVRSVGLKASSIAEVSERAGELLSTLLHNLMAPEDARFCEGIKPLEVDGERLAIVRDIIAKRSRHFIDALTTELAHEAVSGSKGSKPTKVGIMIHAYEKTGPSSE
jgi:hypothetical protein